MTDHLTIRDNKKMAGRHLLVDFYGCSNLDNGEHVLNALCNGALAAGATILHNHIHQFSSTGGLSGVVILSESHITIHTWPELGFAALDIFLCGQCDPHDALKPIEHAFMTQQKIWKEVPRCLLPSNSTGTAEG